MLPPVLPAFELIITRQHSEMLPPVLPTFELIMAQPSTRVIIFLTHSLTVCVFPLYRFLFSIHPP